MLELYEHQKKAIEQLHNGSILVGDTGTGKSLTGLAYYFIKVCGGKMENGHGYMKWPKNYQEVKKKLSEIFANYMRDEE